MTIDNKEYYEKFEWDKANLSHKLHDKIKIILNIIPDDVRTILDIGCGDGTISNELNHKYSVCALDRSRSALKYVKTPKILASADNIGILSHAFDLVFSSEMLEHLPDHIFAQSICEMKRITKKYIFITFPNNENVEKGFIKCIKCGFIFNRSYHQRRLNMKIIKNLFPEYKVIKSSTFGKKVRKYNNFLGKIKHKLSPADSWIPTRWTPNKRRNSLCPKCGNTFEIPYRFNLISTLCDTLNILISPKIPFQLFILLEKI